MWQLIKKIADVVDQRDLVAGLGLASLIAGVALVSIPAALVVLGTSLLGITVGPAVLASFWKTQR